MNRGSNNPSKMRKHDIGATPPGSSQRPYEHYPLDSREQELEGEINSPTIPTVYKRVMTINNETNNEATAVSEGSHNPAKYKNTDGPPTEWDQVAPLSETNVTAKFVSLSIDPQDEPFPANSPNPKN